MVVHFQTQHAQFHLGLDFLCCNQHLDFLVFGKHSYPPIDGQHDPDFLVLEHFYLDQLFDGWSYKPHNHLNDVQSVDYMSYPMVIQNVDFLPVRYMFQQSFP